MRRRSPGSSQLVSACHDLVLYAPSTPLMRNHDRSRQARVSLPLLGRPIPSPLRHVILDDTLLGSAWRWDADDDRGIPAR